MFRRCKEHGRQWCWRCVWFTLGFPVEHLLWERTPLHVVVGFLGLPG